MDWVGVAVGEGSGKRRKIKLTHPCEDMVDARVQAAGSVVAVNHGHRAVERGALGEVARIPDRGADADDRLDVPEQPRPGQVPHQRLAQRPGAAAAPAPPGHKQRPQRLAQLRLRARGAVRKRKLGETAAGARRRRRCGRGGGGRRRRGGGGGGRGGRALEPAAVADRGEDSVHRVAQGPTCNRWKQGGGGGGGGGGW